MCALKAGGFDIVLEMGEQLPNKLMLAYYCMGKFPRMTGSYTLPILNVPEDLTAFITINYDVRFGLPIVDFIAPDKVKILLSSESNFIVLGGIPLKLEIFFSIITTLVFDNPTKQLLLDFTNPHIDIEINDNRISPDVRDKLNEIMAIVLREYLRRDIPRIDLAPFVKYDLSLPGISENFPIEFRNSKITDNMLAMAINCLNYNGGSKVLVKDFRGGTDLAVSVSEDAMVRVLDFWWRHGQIKKHLQDRGVIANFTLQKYIKNFDTYLDLFFPASFLASFLARFEGLSVTYNYSIDLEKPDLNLRHHNKMALQGKANARFSLKLNLHYKKRKIKKFKIVWKHYTKTLASWTDDARISYLGQAQVLLDQNGKLSADLNWVRLLIDVDDFPKMLDVAFTVLANLVAEKFIKKYPPIELGSMPLNHSIPGTRLKLSFSPTLSTTYREAFIKTPVEISGYYIANSNPACLEVHEADCEWVKLITEENKRPYYWLKDAHKDGYDNCFYCLGDSKR